jgi:S-DNA-T family DNA segregation ATPase FtsK/SpoIIIE
LVQVELDTDYDMPPASVVESVVENTKEAAVSPAPRETVVTPVEELDAFDAPEPTGLTKRRAAPPVSDPMVRITPGHLESGINGSDDLVVRQASPEEVFELPTLGLLDRHAKSTGELDLSYLKEQALTLQEKLADFGVKGEVTAIRPGPVITIFEYLPAPGVKVGSIVRLTDDITMAMKAIRVRIVAPIPGKGVVGIEIPNSNRQTVWLRDLLASKEFRDGNFDLPMALGKTVEGLPFAADLAKMPHCLVGGTTGSGKSVGINAMLMSLLYTRTPEELRLILIDPKMLEFEPYEDIPHLLHPVVTEPKLAAAALKWACKEMDERYRLLARWGTRNIASYNKKVARETANWTREKARKFAPRGWPADQAPPEPKKMPWIVIVIDELADLMMVSAKEVEASIVRLAQKARACGIHLIVATQRPSVDVITGLIKANMPSRIAFQVRSKTDGRTILDQNGAETLLGKGDLLYLPPGVSSLARLHGPFVSDEEVARVTGFLKEQARPLYEADIREDDESVESLAPEDYDEVYDVAVQLVTKKGKASTSMIQRHLKIGYNRAARIMDLMEREGVVGPADGARPRQVLAPAPPSS